MQLEHKNIGFVCSFESSYGGNFIKMLTALGCKLKNYYDCRVCFLFPEQSPKKWLTQLSDVFPVDFAKMPYGESVASIVDFLNTHEIDIVHTHFDNYDIPVSKAVKLTGHNIKMVWHLHDYLSLDKTGMTMPFVRKVGTHMRYWRQYGWYGRNAYFIGVSAEVANIASHYRHGFLTFPKKIDNDRLVQMSFQRAEVVINGIDKSRYLGKGTFSFRNGKSIFLSFGGESYSKGIPCILDACEMLAATRTDFEFWLTKGYSTDYLIKSRYGNECPIWLNIIEQTDNVAYLFSQCTCYISASLKETMSMAIAEASIYGLPIIQSDIPGTWWNTDTPSSFVFKVKDSNDLCKTMLKVMDRDKHLMSQECAISSEINEERLSMETWCANIISIYLRI